MGLGDSQGGNDSDYKPVDKGWTDLKLGSKVTHSGVEYTVESSNSVGTTVASWTGEKFFISPNGKKKQTVFLHAFSRGDVLKYKGEPEITDVVSSLVTEGYMMESGNVLELSQQKSWIRQGLLKSGLATANPVKQDAGKLRWDILPFWAMDQVVEVLTLGEIKYPSTAKGLNWYVKSKKSDLPRYEAAILRHMSQHMQGEYLDDETGKPHLAHIVANCLFLIELRRKYAL